MHGTVFGRRVFAVGDNARAAGRGGVKVEFVNYKTPPLHYAMCPAICSAGAESKKGQRGARLDGRGGVGEIRPLFCLTSTSGRGATAA